jgi:hypothetical protein
MKKMTRVLWPALTGALFVTGATPKADPVQRKSWAAGQTRPTAFVGVSVATMENDRILSDWTVVVEGGRISRMGPAREITPPVGAVQVDGKGRYLIPGLSDMHVHFGADSVVNEALLQLYLANGVTQVLNLHGSPLHLRMRSRVAAGELVGPTIFTAGPIVGDTSLTFEQGERIAADYRSAGYDVIKVYNQLTRDGYRGITMAAKREGIPVIGHIVRGLGLTGLSECEPSRVICHCPDCLEISLRSGQIGIVHIEEVMYSELDYHPTKNPKDLAALEAEILPAAKQIGAAGVWVTPTLEAYRSISAQINDLTKALSDPNINYVPVQGRANWGPPHNSYLKRYRPSDGPPFFKAYRFQQKMVKSFEQAGIKLMAGTDVGLPTIVAGFSLHRDLQDMVDAGLTPYQAVVAATRNPGAFVKEVLKAPEDRGTIAVGQRADLVLLDANPLADVRNTTRINGVMARGRWYDRPALDRVLRTLLERSGTARAPETM